MLPMLQIGPFNIQTGGLTLVLAAWLGMVSTEKSGKYSIIPPQQVSDALFWGLGGWIVLARLGYSFATPAVLLQNPLNLFSLNTYQFDSFSGFAGFFLIIAIFSSQKHISFRLLLDALTPFFICMAAGYSLSTLATGEVYGSPASIPWVISIWNTSRHPVQIYDLILISGLVLLFIKLLSGFKEGSAPGSKFIILLAVLAFDQIITIPFRADPGITSVQGIRLEQIAAWIILAVAILIMGKWLQPVQSKQEKSS